MYVNQRCRCPGCVEANRTYNKQIREKYRERFKFYAYRNRRMKSMRLRETKAQTPCHDCGNSFPWYVMEYDHVPERGIKVKSPGQMTDAGWSKIQTELDKCDIVCANCHKVRTYNRNQQGINVEFEDVLLSL